MEKAGQKMTRSVTIPTLAVAAAGVKFASDWQKAWTDVEALVGMSAEQVAKFKGEVLDLAPTVGKAPRELAEAFYFIASSGLEGEAALRALKASALASAAGLGTTMVVADAVTSAINAYGEANLSATKATDILTAAVREGKSEPEEFAASIGRVIPLASKMGVEFGEVAGIMAAMSLNGTNAHEAVTQITSMLSTAIKPTKEGAEALASIGRSYADVREQIADEGLLAAVEDLNKAFDGDIEKLGGVFRNIRALRGILALTGPEAKKYAGIIREVNEAHGDTAMAAAIALEKDGARIAKAWAQIQVNLIKIGDILLPMIAEISDEVRDAAAWFDQLDDATKRNVVQFALVAAAAGPVLTVLGKTTKAVLALRAAYVALAGAQTLGIVAGGAKGAVAAGGAAAVKGVGGAAAAGAAGSAAAGAGAGALAGLATAVPVAGIAAAIATAIAIGVKEGMAEAAKVAAEGGSGWQQFWEGLKKGAKAPGEWFADLMDTPAAQAQTALQTAQQAMDQLAAKAATASGKQFTDLRKAHTGIQQLLAKDFKFGNVDGKHTDAQLRSIRDRIIGETGLTRKQADAIMRAMFKDWRPQPVVTGKINPAMSAAEKRIAQMRAIAAKQTRFGAADNTALLNSIGQVIGSLQGMAGAARSAATAAARAARINPGQIGYAAGGIVTRPEFALVGEAGPEAIIPLTRPQRAAEIMREAGLLDDAGSGGSTRGMAGGTRIVNVYIDGYNKSVDEIMAEAEDYERRMSRAV
jgi:TP901 family phage tail tape measure protein